MQILVVDDDLPNVKLTAFVLSEAGYHVYKAFDGSSALKAVAQYQPDLVLLDVAMAPTDGFEVCKQIRNISNVPVIFLSGRSGLRDRVDGLEIGGDDYLVKPCEPTELLARVKAMLRRRSSDTLASVNRLNQSELVLDSVGHTVTWRDGRKAELTPLEFRLLYYLVQNEGRIIPASQLLTQVWGYDSNSDSHVVAMYIRRIRTKVEPDADHPCHIITVRNIGYTYRAG